MLDQILDALTRTAQDIVNQFGSSWQELGRLLTLARYGWVLAFGMEFPLIVTLGALALGAGVLWEFTDVFTRTGSMGLGVAWAAALAIYTMLVAGGLKACASGLGGFGGLGCSVFILVAAFMFEDAFVDEIAKVIR